MAGQPRCWGSVGEPNFSSNQRATTGWNWNDCITWQFTARGPGSPNGRRGRNKVSATLDRTDGWYTLGQSHHGSKAQAPIYAENAVPKTLPAQIAKNSRQQAEKKQSP